jgi:hypothetical protein
MIAHPVPLNAAGGAAQDPSINPPSGFSIAVRFPSAGDGQRMPRAPNAFRSPARGFLSTQINLPRLSP